LQRATSLTPALWADIPTNLAATNGMIQAVAACGDLGSQKPRSAYYRLNWQP